MNIILNKSETDLRRLKMGEEPGKLFIGAVNSQVTKEEFQCFFEKFGEVSDIVLMEDSITKKNRGFGFVTFADPAVATKIMQTGPHLLNGREIDPKPSVQRGQLPPSKPMPHKSLDKKVFVGGIAQGTSEEGLRNFFNSQNLPVQDIVLMHDSQTLKSRGFGFVTFADDNTVDRVCRTRFFNIDNKTVECKKAEPRGRNEMGGPGGGGPGGPGGPGGNFNPMHRGGQGGGPNNGGFNQGWNPNPNQGFGNNQYNQGGGNFGQQGGWGGPPQQGQMGGNYGQQQQQGYGPRGGQMPNQGFRNQYNNGNQGGYNQQQPPPPQQQQQAGYNGGYGQPQQQQQQQQPQQQQQQPQQQQQGNYGRPNVGGDVPPLKSPRFNKPLGVPQTYGNYGNYQQPQQQQQAQPQQQPDQYNQQTPQQPTNQGYNAGNFNQPAQPNNFPQNGNMGNYPQEASGYGPQRVNYSAPTQGNFTQPQAGGYGTDPSMNYGSQATAAAPQQQQQQQHPPPQQQQPPQQNYGQPAQGDHSQEMYGGTPQAAGNFAARGGNNAAVPFHPYRR